MTTKEQNVEKMCSFYVSDFHFEMIILPYINKKLEENYKIQIISENDLRESIKVLLSRINLSEDRKENLINLNWNNSKIKIPSENEKTVIFIKGNEEFLEKNNTKLENSNLTSELIIVNCYDLEEIKPKMDMLSKKYKKVLNILGEKDF